MPLKIRRLAGRYMREPQTVAIGETKRTVASLDLRYYLVNEADKLSALCRVIEMEDMTSALIFVRTRVGTGELVNALSNRGPKWGPERGSSLLLTLSSAK